jgi:penicillin-binding protein 1B
MAVVSGTPPTGGARAEPEFLHRVTSSDGTTLEQYTPQTRGVLDARVAFLVDSVLQDVLSHGTGAAVRARGFTLPAAGKTGTSRDGWFAGFTSNLVCVIWVGFDDNRDLGLTGGAADAPIWADFMLRATALPAYKDVKDFSIPEGVQSVLIDPESLQLATPSCPTTRQEVYVAGSAPTEFCDLHGGHNTASTNGNWLSHIFGGGQPKAPQTTADGTPITSSDVGGPAATQSGVPTGTPAEKKKSPLAKIFGIFGGKKKDPEKDKPPPE